MKHTSPDKAEILLKIVAERGEIDAQTFLKNVPRRENSYVDFYPVAALLHARYLATDTTFERGGEKVREKLGITTKDTAISLCQLALPPGQSFDIEGCARDSWHDADISVDITAEGFLRLDELGRRIREQRQKRIDYLVAVFVAIVAAVLSTFLTHHFAGERLKAQAKTIER